MNLKVDLSDVKRAIDELIEDTGLNRREIEYLADYGDGLMAIAKEMKKKSDWAPSQSTKNYLRTLLKDVPPIIQKILSM